MKNFTKEKQIEAVTGWWNSDQIKKWDKQYDNWDQHTVRSLNRRLEKILQFVDSISLSEGAKVLDLGYGAGQISLEIGKRGFEVHGLDISNKLKNIAIKRCSTECPEGKFHFKIGSLDSKLDYQDNTFDLVIISGVLHYLYNPEHCTKEVYRILSKSGHLIIGQRTAYSLSQLASIRTFICSLLYFILREKYELFPSYKSMLCDSKLGYFFNRFRDNKIFNSKFMLKGHDNWQYKLKKNLFTNSRLKTLIKKSGLVHVQSLGAYYCYSDNPKYFNFNLKIDDLFNKITSYRLLSHLSGLSRITVMLAKK